MNNADLMESAASTSRGLTGISLGWCILIGVGVMAVAAFVEHEMGRRLISQSGRICLWVSAVNSAENSQQIADWYSFSHIIHGFFFYWFFRLIGRRRWSVGFCLLLTICVESSWEMIENSSLIIDRYRHTMSLHYYGDSILNSMFDILFCVLGFVLAARIPAQVTIALIVIMEVGVAYAIRDNLTLNIIMLIHPFAGIRHWQMGLR